VDARIRIQKVERYGIFGMRRNTTQPEEFGEQLP